MFNYKLEEGMDFEGYRGGSLKKLGDTGEEEEEKKEQ